jgi:hypothetical protein
METWNHIAGIVLVGIGASIVMDSWSLALKGFGIPPPNFAFVGRWAGHMLRGSFAHAAIGQAAPVRGERVWGWLIHYAIGIAFAALLVGFQGVEWLRTPSLWPALAVGVGTVVAPLCVMQPAMGAGFAGRKTTAPFKNGLRSLANHTVFGLGLYLSAAVLAIYRA